MTGKEAKQATEMDTQTEARADRAKVEEKGHPRERAVGVARQAAQQINARPRLSILNRRDGEGKPHLQQVGNNQLKFRTRPGPPYPHGCRK